MNQIVRDIVKPGIVPILQRELKDLVAEVDAQPVMHALLDGTAGHDVYIAFLVQTRHYVARTFPTLTVAGQRCRALGRKSLLSTLYGQKAKEEVGHEVLIDDDLRSLGVDLDAALAAGPSRWTGTYIAWIEAMSNGFHPSGFLGSAYVLEGLAVHRAGPIAKALRAANRIDNIEEALTFLELHAEADVGHVDDMDRILADLQDPGEVAAIAMTAAATRTAYVGLLDEIAEAASLRG